MGNSFHLPVLLVLLVFVCFEPQQSTVAQNFDFFYLVLQWPGSYCDTRKSCCYPTTGKPAANFSIHGLWHSNNDGSYPSNCDLQNPFDFSQINDLRSDLESNWPMLTCPSGDGLKFWGYEWDKHGTCSESILDQHRYFLAALDFKEQLDLLGALKREGMVPDGGFYTSRSISQAIARGSGGKSAGIECNVDESGNRQLYQIFLCLDKSASEFIDCPLLPKSQCSTNKIEFPAF